MFQRLEDGGIVEHVIGQVVIGFQLVFHGLHGLGERFPSRLVSRSSMI